MLSHSAPMNRVRPREEPATVAAHWLRMAANALAAVAVMIAVLAAIGLALPSHPADARPQPGAAPQVVTLGSQVPPP